VKGVRRYGNGVGRDGKEERGRGSRLPKIVRA